MTENLADMVKNDTPISVPVEDLSFDLDTQKEKQNTEDQTTTENVNQNEEIPSEGNNEVIQTTSLNVWFEQNHAKFENINQVRVSSTGIDSNKIIVVKVPDPRGGEDETGNSIQKLQVFEDVDMIPVLDLPGSDMKVFNNGYQIIYNYNDEITIKCYGVKTGMIIVFCNNINDQDIPYHIIKLKRKDTELKVFRNSLSEVVTKLSENAELENAQLLYKQISKHTKDMVTKSDAVNWLINRQSGIMDVNHLFQIDKTIIKILS